MHPANFTGIYHLFLTQILDQCSQSALFMPKLRKITNYAAAVDGTVFLTAEDFENIDSALPEGHTIATIRKAARDAATNKVLENMVKAEEQRQKIAVDAVKAGISGGKKN